MADTPANRVQQTFLGIDELLAGIDAARTFGMRDLTVTTVHHKASYNDRNEWIGASTKYHLDCAVLAERTPEQERQLAHVDAVRVTLDHVRQGA